MKTILVIIAWTCLVSAALSLTGAVYRTIKYIKTRPKENHERKQRCTEIFSLAANTAALALWFLAFRNGRADNISLFIAAFALYSISLPGLMAIIRKTKEQDRDRDGEAEPDGEGQTDTMSQPSETPTTDNPDRP